MYKTKKLKYHIYISIQTLYSVLCWNTFGSDYSHESSWAWHYKLGPPVFGEFLPFFSADPIMLCQVGWGESIQSNFSVSSEMFDRVQVRALAGPFKDIQSLVPKPLVRCLGCVQSEVLSPLEQIFIKDLSVLCSVDLSLDPEKSLSPCRWKTSPQHDAATTMLHHRDGTRFPPDVTLGIQAKELNLGFI